ncbi:leucine-rich repeat-containing protein 66 [Oxyura jamaicensis]|uniref:leucine-rich repeat-containing protein 66 n=1 Tax=Oxyura jamaicensis TaxID=8884 RepID=UPI0015A54EA4|nr:leucine-rich repeat-containing protein 66 [Oxyura jamaicensis]
MDNLHLSVVAVVLYFNIPGSVGTKSQQLLNAHHHSDCRWDGKFSVNCSFTGLSAIPEDISQTAITADLSYNNITTLLHTTGRNEDWMLKHLNLSNNLISELSVTAFRNLPVLETLNLNSNSINTLTLDISTAARASDTYGKVHHFLPALKVLSAERNYLDAVPRGLGLLRSLQSVRLSFNGILRIDRNDFQNCSQLRTIYLQNNRIATIHPDAFQGLNNLQVVDLRDNALTTVLPQIILHLNIFQLEVDLSRNSWIFNCRLNAFKHLIPFLSDSMRKTLSTSHSKSATNSQKPVLYLSRFHLNCSEGILFKTAAIPAGQTSVLRCDMGNTGGNRVSWWTPKGRISEESSLPHVTLDKRSSLVIHNAEKTAEGLYVCIFNTTKQKYLIYNVQVKERVSTSLVRKTRDANPVFRQERTKQDLTLAICLSVFITFFCAFCLGVFARPYLAHLWMYMRRNKSTGSEHTYCNEAFSDETLSRARYASQPPNRQQNLSAIYENSSRRTRTVPTDTDHLYACVTDTMVHTPNAEEYPNQNSKINVKKDPLFSDIQANSSNSEYMNFGQPSARTDNKEITPRNLISNDTSLWERSQHANSEDLEKSRFPPIPSRTNDNIYSIHIDSSDSDLSYARETGIPLPRGQSHTSAQDSRNSKVGNNAEQLQSEITEPAPDSPLKKGIVSHNEHLSTAKLRPGRERCDEELGLNGNINITSDAGECTLSRNCTRDTKTEDLSDFRKIENSPHAQYDCTIETTNERGNLADFFGDSSSDEGTAFTMSDGSSLEDFELEQPGASSSLPAPQPSLEKADTDNGSDYCSALPEHPNIAAKLQHAGKNEDKHNVDLENTTDGVRYYQLLRHYYGSDTITPEAASPDTDKCSDRVNMSDSDSISSSQKASETFDYSTNEESTVQNSISDSPHKHDADFSNASLLLKPFPVYARDTENTPEDADLQLQFPIRPQHFLRSSPTEQKEHAPEVSTEELTDGSSSESDRDEGDVTLRQNSSTSENNYFTFTPIDVGLNQTVKKAPLRHASIGSNESPLQSPLEDRTEKPFKFISEKEDSLAQGEHGNRTKTWGDKMQRSFNEEEHDEHIELQDSSNCSSPEEMQPRSVLADLLHIESSRKTEPAFNTGKYFQLDPSEENAYSLSVPSSFFNESLYSSFPQKSTGDNSRNTDSNEKEDDTTLPGLKNNYTTAVSLPNASEKLTLKPQTRQGQFFAKKKRAFDGFAVMLQSRTECSSSDTEV